MALLNCPVFWEGFHDISSYLMPPKCQRTNKSPSFLHLLNKWLLSPYYVPDAINTGESKADAVSAFMELTLLWIRAIININKTVMLDKCLKENKQEVESK